MYFSHGSLPYFLLYLSITYGPILLPHGPWLNCVCEVYTYEIDYSLENLLYFIIYRKLAKFALVLIPLFGVTYIVTSAYPLGLNLKADMVYLYWDMFYNSFQVRFYPSQAACNILVVISSCSCNDAYIQALIIKIHINSTTAFHEVHLKLELLLACVYIRNTCALIITLTHEGVCFTLCYTFYYTRSSINNNL